MKKVSELQYLNWYLKVLTKKKKKKKKHSLYIAKFKRKISYMVIISDSFHFSIWFMFSCFHDCRGECIIEEGTMRRNACWVRHCKNRIILFRLTWIPASTMRFPAAINAAQWSLVYSWRTIWSTLALNDEHAATSVPKNSPVTHSR